jgi:hypothetical protein
MVSTQSVPELKVTVGLASLTYASSSGLKTTLPALGVTCVATIVAVGVSVVVIVGEESDWSIGVPAGA